MAFPALLRKCLDTLLGLPKGPPVGKKPKKDKRKLAPSPPTEERRSKVAKLPEGSGETGELQSLTGGEYFNACLPKRHAEFSIL